MYIGDDTRTMTFILREVMHMHTQSLAAHTGNDAPGRIIRVIASPLSCMLKKDGTGTYHVNTLGITASRWREIRYVGTRVQFVPLATTGRVDPANITQASGPDAVPAHGSFSPQGSIHPYDAMNFIHWRRWTGGNLNVPSWPETPVPTSRGAYVKKSLAFDQEWLADDRFNHAKLTDGMQFDAVPLRVDLETSALAGNSLFGFASMVSMTPSRDRIPIISGYATENQALDASANLAIGNPSVSPSRFDEDLTGYFQPMGLLTPTAGKDYHEQGWLPNPFAGFRYNGPAEIEPGNEDYTITSYNPKFPWFADQPDLTPLQYKYKEGLDEKWASTLSLSLGYLVNLCIERFIAPIAVVRLPPAYGSMFFWTAYMAHVFQLRKPFLTNSAWTVGRVEDLGHDVTPIDQLTGTKSSSSELTVIGEEEIYQSIGPDPYGLAESPSTVTLMDVAPHMTLHAEPWKIVNGTKDNTDSVRDESEDSP